MSETSGSTGDLAALEKTIAALARSVRRQSIALWALLAVLVLLYGTPWILFLVQSMRYPDTRGIPAAESKVAEPRPVEEAWDNDFHARSPQDKIDRATAILLTRIEQDGARHRQIVAEILKREPDVRLYYKVGDEYEGLSHAAPPDCPGCGGQGSIVFLLGNPATMAESMTYEGDRILALGDMPIAEIRRLITESAARPL